MTSGTLSWVLAAHDPNQLAGFYAALFGVEQHQGFSASHRYLDLEGALRLEIYRPSSRRPFPARGRCLAPCLRLSPDPQPLDQLMRQLPAWLAIGATVVEPARLEPFGAEVWLGDPEGNPVLVMQPFV
ncbi:MAG: VOC family protein [Cyanobacteriota bacterium]|nr:VOC family protein [Cyanobacteriota bacterium]